MKETALSKESYFTFQLGTGIFAVPVTSVKEVLKYETITPVPKSLPYLKGVMNIRGSVVTVADFRVLFGFQPVTALEKTSIIVTEITEEEGQPPSVLGLIADSVDVVSRLALVPSETVDYGIMPERRDFISAVARREDTFILILDLKKILSSIESEIG